MVTLLSLTQNIQLEQATKLILSHFWEEYHLLIYDTLNNKIEANQLCIFVVEGIKNNGCSSSQKCDSIDLVAC